MQRLPFSWSRTDVSVSGLREFPSVRRLFRMPFGPSPINVYFFLICALIYFVRFYLLNLQLPWISEASGILHLFVDVSVRIISLAACDFRGGVRILRNVRIMMRGWGVMIFAFQGWRIPADEDWESFRRDPHFKRYELRINFIFIFRPKPG